MRSRVYSLFVAAIALAVIPVVSAEAGHRAPRGYYGPQTVYHYGYYPRYRDVYYSDFRPDPYAYRYTPRGYYPYYNSGYWRPTNELRFRKACCRPNPVLPPYYQAWGYPKRYYHRGNYRKWNRYGYHRRHW